MHTMAVCSPMMHAGCHFMLSFCSVVYLSTGASSGAFAAAATTPLDVIKTNMMCSAASKPSMFGTAKTIYSAGGFRSFFAGVGPRAASNGINSAVFFCFFEAFRNMMLANQAKAVTASKSCHPSSREGIYVDNKTEKRGRDVQQADYSIA